MRFRAIDSANQLDAGGDVAPLVAATELQRDVVATAELEEVVGLKQHVCELGEGDTRVHAGPHRILLEHVVHGEVLPRVAQELHHRQWREPLRIVAHARGVLAREVEKPLELRPNGGRVRRYLLRRE